MLLATIDNFRGIEHAEIDITGLALVAGINASGKSSVARAVAAAVTGEVVPFEGVKKSEAGMLVRASTGGSTVEITDGDDNRTVVKYPSGKIKSEGRPPSATPFAAGLRSVLDLPQKEASAVLLEYLKALPTPGDLKAAIADLDLAPDAVKKLCDTVAQLGWDGAHRHAKETGIKLKGQWESITGERYGPTKAESWLPGDWSTDLDGASEESLQAAVTEAGEFVEAAIASSAVSAAERERLEKKAANVDAVQAELADAEAKVDAARGKLSEAMDRRDALPLPDSVRPITTPCPHCGEAVEIRGGALHKPPTGVLRSEENDAREAALQAARQEVNSAEAEVRTWSGVATGIRSRLQGAEQAAAQLAELGEPTGGDDADQLNAARARARDAEKRLAAYRSKVSADSKHRSIERNQHIVATLAPDGLRLTKLKDALKAFNDELAADSTTADWGRVEVSDDLTVSYGRRPWPLLSGSERFRCRVTLQVAMARRDKSDVVIVDAADILDRPGRNGLIRLLASLGQPALICMTMLDFSQVPNLATKQLGVSYWLDAAVAQRIQ